MQHEAIPTFDFTKVTFKGKGTILKPFICSDNVPNNVSISQFFIQLPYDSGMRSYLCVQAGSNGTNFVINAFRDCNGLINFSIATDVGFNAAHPECLLDYRDLEASIRLVAIPGFSMTESSSDGYENSPTTFILEKFNNPTIVLGDDQRPYLEATIPMLEG